MQRAHISARGVAAWLLASAVAIDCSEPTEPPAPRASLSVAVLSAPRPSSTSVDGAPNWNIFSVDVVVKNQSNVAARIPGCGPALEVESPAGGWTVVAEMLCALGAGDAIELPPMGERQWRPTIVMGSRSATTSPGRVRLLFRYHAVDPVGPLDEARSAPFELK